MYTIPAVWPDPAWRNRSAHLVSMLSVAGPSAVYYKKRYDSHSDWDNVLYSRTTPLWSLWTRRDCCIRSGKPLISRGVSAASGAILTRLSLAARYSYDRRLGESDAPANKTHPCDCFRRGVFCFYYHRMGVRPPPSPHHRVFSPWYQDSNAIWNPCRFFQIKECRLSPTPNILVLYYHYNTKKK